MIDLKKDFLNPGKDHRSAPEDDTTRDAIRRLGKLTGAIRKE